MQTDTRRQRYRRIDKCEKQHVCALTQTHNKCLLQVKTQLFHGLWSISVVRIKIPKIDHGLRQGF